MWWTRKEEPAKELEPGICECGHSRCCHSEGKYKCQVDQTSLCSPEDRKLLSIGMRFVCACTVFIPDDDSDDGPTTPVDPELEELKKMIQ